MYRPNLLIAENWVQGESDPARVSPSGFAVAYYFPVGSTCDFAFGHAVYRGDFMTNILDIKYLKG